MVAIRRAFQGSALSTWVALVLRGCDHTPGGTPGDFVLPSTVPAAPPGKNLNLWIGSLSTVVPNLKTIETPVTLRATSLIDAFVWNCIAVYSPTWKDALRPSERPIIGNVPATFANESIHTSDARSLCMAHGLGTMISDLSPDSAEAFQSFMSSVGLQVSMDRGLQSDVEACLGSSFALANRTCFEELATAAGYVPSIVGPALARHVIDYGREDGWNADGKTGCTANCRPFSDTTGYFPRNHPGSTTQANYWEPLLEDNGKGFFFRQAHVVPHIGTSATARIANASVMARQLSDPSYDYTAESDLVISRLAGLTDLQKMQIEFYDDKVAVVLGIITALLQKFPAQTSFERAAFFFVGYTGIEHDALVLVWKEKVRLDRVRTTTIIQARGSEQITTYAGPAQGVRAFEAKDFQPYKRVMPHAEYPSGSACLCTAAYEFTDAFQAYLYSDTTPLTMQLAFPVGSSSVEPGVTPASNLTVPVASMEAMRDACGQSRLDGGMHFSASVPDGNTLCTGMGAAAVAYLQTLASGTAI